MAKAAWERFVAVDHAMCLMVLQFCSGLHAVLGKKCLYMPDDDKLFE